jgi:transposase
MVFVGIDLHKKTIVCCVVDQRCVVVQRKTLLCADPRRIVAFFGTLGAFQAVVEATASYEWLWRLLEPLADRLVRAHPKKLRIIAESRKKSDKLDAQVLAEFLAKDEVPESYRPTPRQRQHRLLVRHRCYVRRRGAATRVKIRRILADSNADRADLFTGEGLTYLEALKLPEADRFVVDQLVADWEHQRRQLRAVEQRLKAFAQDAPAAEAEARAVLASVPGVGAVTVDVVLSEVPDIRRFRSVKDVVAYAGLARASASRRANAGRWPSPRRARGSYAGRWSRPPGDWCD